jgi:hypothetical protein
LEEREQVIKACSKEIIVEIRKDMEDEKCRQGSRFIDSISV